VTLPANDVDDDAGQQPVFRTWLEVVVVAFDDEFVTPRRCATAFALGACGGVRSISMPAAVTAVSNAAVNFVSRS
jgi:hypothetical protein